MKNHILAIDFHCCGDDDIYVVYKNEGAIEKKNHAENVIIPRH